MRSLAASIVAAVLLAFALTFGLGAQQIDPLIQPADLAYAGCFRLPNTPGDETKTFHYGASVLAWDQWRNSIWGVGHDQQQPIGEIVVPATLGTGTLASCPVAVLKQPWIQTPWRSQIGGRTPKIGGILPTSNGDIIVSAYDFYDNVGIAVSHFRRTLSGTVTGPVRAYGDAPGGGFAAGRMIWIPSAWQALLGYPALTGQCCLSTINRTSLGPALIGFDPADVAGQNPVTGTWFLGYPNEAGKQTLGTTAAGTLYNGSVNNDFAGLVWIDGTRTILAIQEIGTGTVTYSNGYNAAPYVIMALAYDANDLVLVAGGKMNPWDVVPYANWIINLPLSTLKIPGPLNVAVDQQAITYDPASKRLFFSVHTGISGGEHVVLVYNVRGMVTNPPTDTTAPTVSLGVSAASVVVNNAVTLTATAADNVAISSVVFQVNNGTTTQTLATDTSAPYTTTYTPTVAGAYSFTAIATDTAKNATTSAAVWVNATAAPAPSPVDCVVSEWSEWSAWVQTTDTTESRTRTRTVTTAPANGGLGCPHLTETETRTIAGAPPPPDDDEPTVDLVLTDVTGCRYSIRVDTAPTGYEQGSVQFQRSSNNGLTWFNHGNKDSSAPYERAANITYTSYIFRQVWTAQGRPQLIKALTVVGPCQ